MSVPDPRVSSIMDPGNCHYRIERWSGGKCVGWANSRKYTLRTDANHAIWFELKPKSPKDEYMVIEQRGAR